MIAIFKREVRSSFHGMIGYVLTALCWRQRPSIL